MSPRKKAVAASEGPGNVVKADKTLSVTITVGSLSQYKSLRDLKEAAEEALDKALYEQIVLCSADLPTSPEEDPAADKPTKSDPEDEESAATDDDDNWIDEDDVEDAKKCKPKKAAAEKKPADTPKAKKEDKPAKKKDEEDFEFDDDDDDDDWEIDEE